MQIGESMSIVKRNAKLAKSRKMTAARSERVRKAYARMMEKRAEKDRRDRFSVHIDRNHEYFNVFNRFVLAEANETSAAVSVARRDRAALARKYQSILQWRDEG